MGNGKLWHPADQKPLNRSSPNLIHVISLRCGCLHTKFGRNPSRPRRGFFSPYTTYVSIGILYIINLFISQITVVPFALRFFGK